MRITELLKLALFSSLILVLLLPNFKILAENSTLPQTVENGSLNLFEEKESLEEELKKLEEQINQYEENIGKTQQEKKTLQNQIYVLRQKIEKLNLQIYQSNVVIKDLGLQIKDTEASVEKTSFKIKDSQIKLTNILRTIYECDQHSLIEILLSEEELSDFFNDLMALEILNSKNQELLEIIKTLKSSLESEKQLLAGEKEDTERILKMQTLQKKEQEDIKKEKDYFLKLTEAEYQKCLKEKEAVQKRVVEIRARIFELIGVPEVPTFGEALDIAKYVEKITGVRPAFLLAVMTQESNIGKNVGQCYLKNPSTGEGVVAFNGKEVSRVMKPSRDVEPFLEITKELGRDPYNTLVSCPMSYGWGGAMGPAQFIPFTWMIYRDKVKAIIGKPADPWDIKDAFLAAALYLAHYGAVTQTYNSEFNAALSYFAGPGWYNSNYKNIYKRDYGYPVMSIADSLQKDIDTIEDSN